MNVLKVRDAQTGKHDTYKKFVLKSLTKNHLKLREHGAFPLF